MLIFPNDWVQTIRESQTEKEICFRPPFVYIFALPHPPSLTYIPLSRPLHWVWGTALAMSAEFSLYYRIPLSALLGNMDSTLWLVGSDQSSVCQPTFFLWSKLFWPPHNHLYEADFWKITKLIIKHKEIFKVTVVTVKGNSGGWMESCVFFCSHINSGTWNRIGSMVQWGALYCCAAQKHRIKGYHPRLYAVCPRLLKMKEHLWGLIFLHWYMRSIF